MFGDVQGVREKLGPGVSDVVFSGGLGVAACVETFGQFCEFRRMCVLQLVEIACAILRPGAYDLHRKLMEARICRLPASHVS